MWGCRAGLLIVYIYIYCLLHELCEIVILCMVDVANQCIICDHPISSLRWDLNMSNRSM